MLRALDRRHPRTRGLRPARTAALLVAGAVLSSCASTGDPPGGPPDQQAPLLVSVEPESGAVLQAPPRTITLTFDEVVAERVAGQPTDIGGSVLLSPVVGPVKVGWRRSRITVEPREGFKPGRIYRLEVLPVITDLRTNRMRQGRVILFSTGPAIPGGVLEGSVVDWVAGRPVPRALVEAVLMPDSLPYRALTDSTGYFRLARIPAGRYLVHGVMDVNSDRQRGPREAWDSATVSLDSAGTVELFAFPHDTTGPRLRQVDAADSLTLKLTFDRPLDPRLTLDSASVRVAPLDDSTGGLPLVGVYTQRALDLLRERLADSARAAGSDSSTPAPARAAVPAAAGAGRPALRAPLDSTRAERMLARRPSPTDLRIVRLAEPLRPDTRYVVYVTGVRSLSGNVADARGQVRTPRPAPRAEAGRTAADSTARPRP